MDLNHMDDKMTPAEQNAARNKLKKVAQAANSGWPSDSAEREFSAVATTAAVLELIALVERQEAELAAKETEISNLVEMQPGGALHQPPAQCAAPDERKPALSMFATMDDYREAMTDWQARAALAAQPAMSEIEKMLETNQLDELGAEVARLQTALCFWLPSVTDREDEVAYRMLEDAFLLVGIDGNLPEDFKSAQELGWISLASQPPVQEPVAYLRFRAAQQWSGVGGHGIEHSEWLETCHVHEIGDDKLPAFPVYTAPPPAPVAAPAVAEGWRDLTPVEVRSIFRRWEHCQENPLGLFKRFKDAACAAAPSAPVGGSHD